MVLKRIEQAEQEALQLGKDIQEHQELFLVKFSGQNNTWLHNATKLAIVAKY